MLNSGTIARKLAGFVAILAVAGLAQAASVSSTFFQIDVDDGVNNATWNVSSASPFVTYTPGTETWDWTSAGQFIDLSGLATVGAANLQVRGDNSGAYDYERISLGFALTAGANDVTVTITSTVLSFGALANPDGFSTLAMTVTDNGGDGATLTGVGGDAGSAYAAYYNAPGGTVFAEFLSSLIVPAGSGTGNAGGSTGGLIPIAPLVTSSQVVMSFELSAGDQASATSNYLVKVPEPAGFLLLTLGVVLAARRRR